MPRAATGVIAELRRALNVMFGVQAHLSVLHGLPHARVMGFALQVGSASC
jgi:hypothetical protein